MNYIKGHLYIFRSNQLGLIAGVFVGNTKFGDLFRPTSLAAFTNPMFTIEEDSDDCHCLHVGPFNEMMSMDEVYEMIANAK